MNTDSDFTDTPAYPLGVGEAADHVSPTPRPVEWWGNAKTGLSEPMVVIYNRHGFLEERSHKRASPKPNRLAWLSVGLFLVYLLLLLLWFVLK